MDLRINYDALEWQNKVHVTPEQNLALAGGAGSGKSTCCIREFQALAIQNPGFDYLIGRKTMPSLRDTAMKSFFATIEPGFIKEHNKTHNDVKFYNGAGFMFRGLDDLEKLKSLEIAGFWINEANEIDRDLYNTLKSRVRQKVNGKPPTMYRTIIDLNPTDETHWIPQLFMTEKPPNHKMFLSSTFENRQNLPEGYINELLATYTADMAQRMVYGLFGKVHKGLPVFAQFARNSAYYKARIEPVKGAPIFVGMDFGFNRPAWTWLQFIDGQAKILASKLGHRTDLDDFIIECQKFSRELWGEWTEGYKYFCDPRGSDESDKGKSSIDICNEHGIYPIHRRTYIEEGIKAVKHLLDTKTPGGEPNFLIHHRNGILIDALDGGYHRLDGEDSPNKDGYYDNIVDSMRYALIHLTRRHKFNKVQNQINQQNVVVHPVTGRRIQY